MLNACGEIAVIIDFYIRRVPVCYKIRLISATTSATSTTPIVILNMTLVTQRNSLIKRTVKRINAAMLNILESIKNNSFEL